MPRYFFHLYDGDSDPDTHGTEFADWQSARRHAIELAGEFIRTKPDSVELGELWHMEVVEEGGLVLFRLDFHVTLSPALVHSRAKAGRLP